MRSENLTMTDKEQIERGRNAMDSIYPIDSLDLPTRIAPCSMPYALCSSPLARCSFRAYSNASNAWTAARRFVKCVAWMA
jgi:hypothetical protein